jgi:pSer/pThr/pTyr-binding forkhead associated (FHA) protein
MTSQPAPYARSAREIKAIIEAERAALPFLLWRDGAGEQQIATLEEQKQVTMGRGSSCDLVLGDDGEVSRAHAELERLGEEWAVVDDGLSRNGTFVNGQRISGRRRLADGDVMRLGNTAVEYRRPSETSTVVTSAAAFQMPLETVTETQLRILVALARPYKAGGSFATPASNNEIAAEVFLSVDAVKTHLRTLFRRFEIGDLPQNQKRARLVECAFQWGLVADRDL